MFCSSLGFALLLSRTLQLNVSAEEKNKKKKNGSSDDEDDVTFPGIQRPKGEKNKTDNDDDDMSGGGGLCERRDAPGSVKMFLMAAVWAAFFGETLKMTVNAQR